jgi:hypothetical protein
MMRRAKRVKLLIVLLTCIGYYSFASEVKVDIPVPEVQQQMGTWCWVATSQAILDYHGTSLAQCFLVKWALDWRGPNNLDCCKDFSSCNFLENPPGAHGILENWGISTDFYSKALTPVEIQSEIDSGNPFLRFIRFKNGGAHFTIVGGYSKIVINGTVKFNVDIMDPGPGQYVTLDYEEALYNPNIKWESTLTTESINQNHHSGVIIYNKPGVDPDRQQIHAFFRTEGGYGVLRMYKRYNDKWIWRDQDMGTFHGTRMNLDPGVTTYTEYASNTFYQKIYAFVPVLNGHLHINYFDGKNWKWVDHGTAMGSKVAAKPGVISYSEGLIKKIFAFVPGSNGHLYVHYWNGDTWQWSDRGAPPGTKTLGAPGVITYREKNLQRIYVFVRGLNGIMYLHYWNGEKWKWSYRGKHPESVLWGNPGVITYLEGAKRMIYAFIRGKDLKLYLHYWNGEKWKWSPRGYPGIGLSGDPGVITYRERDKQRIYAFIAGVDGRLYVHYWNGEKWKWSDQGTPPGTKLWVGHSPEVITYKAGGKQRIYVFVKGEDKRVYVRFWDGERWKWRVIMKGSSF